MNRAFLITAVPTVLVAAAYIGVGWGLTVPVSVAVGAVVIAAGMAVVLRKQERKRGEKETTVGHA
jgi:hypothetical protein